MTGTLSRNTIFSISRPLSRRTGTDGHVSVSDLGLERHRQRADGKHRFRRVWVTNPEQDFVSGSDLLSPQLDQITGNAEITADTISEALDAVPLNSERSLDFIKLRDLLRAGEFQTADDESRALLLTLAGTEAQSRGWIYFTEVASIPATDLKTIDSLWKASSNDKFGYSVQRKVRQSPLSLGFLTGMVDPRYLPRMHGDGPSSSERLIGLWERTTTIENGQWSLCIRWMPNPDICH